MAANQTDAWKPLPPMARFGLCINTTLSNDEIEECRGMARRVLAAAADDQRSCRYAVAIDDSEY